MFEQLRFYWQENKHKVVVFGIMAALSIGISIAITGGGDVTAGVHRHR